LIENKNERTANKNHHNDSNKNEQKIKNKMSDISKSESNLLALRKSCIDMINMEELFIYVDIVDSGEI
jgi:hypothetical protein